MDQNATNKRKLDSRLNNQVIRYDSSLAQTRNTVDKQVQNIANKQVKRVDINFDQNKVNNATKGALHNLNRSNIQEWFRKNNVPPTKEDLVVFYNNFLGRKKIG